MFNYSNYLSRVKPYFSPLFLDLAGDDDVILLVGSGRSGTTWAQELINEQYEHRVVFEPFFPKMVPSTPKRLSGRYISPQKKAHKIDIAIEQVLSGKIRNRWVDQFNRRAIYRRRLIKSIRLHLALKRVKVRNPQIKIVFMMRHPCAVVASQVKTDWGFRKASVFTKQSDLVDDYLRPFLPYIEQAQSDFEERIYKWAIENYVVLKQFKPDDIHILFYEELVAHPKKTLVDLFHYLQYELKSSWQEAIEKPSVTTISDRVDIKTDDRLNGWRHQISDDELTRAVEILSVFGLNKIYNEHAMPNSRAVYDMFQRDLE